VCYVRVCECECAGAGAGAGAGVCMRMCVYVHVCVLAWGGDEDQHFVRFAQIICVNVDVPRLWR
jgi:hypothetical protein